MNKTERIVQLHKNGLQPDEIAEAVGFNVHTVRKKLREAKRDYKITMLSDPFVIQLRKHIPDEMFDWLVAQIPEGARMEDVVRSILQDAFDDDRG